MAISKIEARQLLERMIFTSDRPRDWVQDVWDLSPTLGETAARLMDIFDALLDCCPEDNLENLVHNLYEQYLDDVSGSGSALN